MSLIALLIFSTSCKEVTNARVFSDAGITSKKGNIKGQSSGNNSGGNTDSGSTDGDDDGGNDGGTDNSSGSSDGGTDDSCDNGGCIKGCMHKLADNYNPKATKQGYCVFSICLNEKGTDSIEYQEAIAYISKHQGKILHDNEKCDTTTSPTAYCKHPKAVDFVTDPNVEEGPCNFLWCLDPSYKEYDGVLQIIDYVKLYGRDIEHKQSLCKTKKTPLCITTGADCDKYPHP